MKLHYIASDTKKEFDFEWKNAVIIGDTDFHTAMMADYVPGVKNRFCKVGEEIFKGGVMTISCYDEKTITTFIKHVIECHNEGRDPFEEPEEIKEARRLEYAYLDSLSQETYMDYLKSSDYKLEDMMEQLVYSSVGDKYEEFQKTQNSKLKKPDDEMFNQITCDDFKNYLIKRFNFKFNDVSYTEARV